MRASRGFSVLFISLTRIEKRRKERRRCIELNYYHTLI